MNLARWYRQSAGHRPVAGSTLATLAPALPALLAILALFLNW